MKELLKQLIQAESTESCGELNSAKVIYDEFARYGIKSEIETWDNTRANITAHIKSSGKKPALLFACHIDVVGPGKAKWTNPPFTAVETDGKIYGRGSTDMKGGTAAAATAICEIVKSGVELQGDIIFTAVAGEETDSCGALRFMAKKDQIPKLQGVLIPEPTDFTIVSAHRGILWLDISTKGIAAHGSTPHLGVNAITSMRRFLNELDNYDIAAKQTNEILGTCSMSVNTISGGKTRNAVPDQCSCSIDIRIIPGVDTQDIMNDFRNIIAKVKSEHPEFEAKVSIDRQASPLETDRNSDFVKDFCTCLGIEKTVAVGFTTDGPHFVDLGAPILIYGPGKPDICHKPDEFIEIADAEKAVQDYKKLITKFLT
ncbi:MAG: M20 family metallopeptidase [Sedimentisphaerales bacterium]|nr:M20 family metallopeptidase [Sedimentisphaerales bacterium]